MSRRPCSFYNTPGGCRNGSGCRFAHSPAGPRSATPSSRDAGTQGGRAAGGQSPAPSPPAGSAPPGACREFWASGSCKHEFRCRYRHERPQGAEDRALPPNQPVSAIETIAPFLNDMSLARLADSGTDAYGPVTPSRGMTPTEVQNHLRIFLYDNYRFRSVTNVYGFAKILESANTSNVAWSQEEGQLLLSALATGNGLLRLIDIIQWHKVSVRAGQNREILSFQKGYFPVLRYLSSDFVTRSTLSHLVNALYSSLIMENFDHVAKIIQECMDDAIAQKTFKDSSQFASNQVGGSQILACLCGILFEILTRFKNAVPTHRGLRPLVLKLRDWASSWVQGVSESTATFNDAVVGLSSTQRQTIIEHLQTKLDSLVSIVDREQAKMDRMNRRPESGTTSTKLDCDEAIAAALLNAYDGPGEERAGGPRHDNDFVDLDHIRTVPTNDELACRIPPFLPANIYGAPHPFPLESMQRLLDIQFRLLREELTAPMRTSAQLIIDDLRAPLGSKTRLHEIVKNGGGKYRSYADKLESIMFNVYTEVEFTSLTPDRRGLSIQISLDSPPGRARSAQPAVRARFWEGVSGKRLMQGGLVALIWKSVEGISVHLGVVASSTRDLTDAAKQNSTRVTIRVVFFDGDLELRILRALKSQDREGQESKLLIEAPVMFESIRPFLEALRAEPEMIPFAKYLVHRPSGYLQNLHIDPPSYCRHPGFNYKLDCLFDNEVGVQDIVLNPSSEQSVEVAREVLRRASRLDPSQATAVVDALTREIALIQGPPGTGKSYTGVELLRVLLANKIRPILMIAFTNHALDHLLRSVLETGVTQRIVRLGSRSTDEKIAQLNIESLEMLAGQSRLDRGFASHHRELKQVQQELKDLMESFLRISIDSENLVQFMEIRYPEHYESLIQPQSWVSLVHQLQADANEGYQTVGRRQSAAVDNSLYAFWRNARDLEFIASTDGSKSQSETKSTKAATSNTAVPSRSNNIFNVLRDNNETTLQVESTESTEVVAQLPEEQWMDILYESDVENEVEEPSQTSPENVSNQADTIAGPRTLQVSDLRDPSEFFMHFGLRDVPRVPCSKRSLEELLALDDIWSLSKEERERLHGLWEDQVRRDQCENQVVDFEKLRRKHRAVLEVYNEGKRESRRSLLKNVDIIGCTTTGAANLTALLKSIAPRVLLVEEAGQVLEAHVLGSLVPSIQHVIMIGDPLQLRPTISNFSLSMDNRQGAQLYRFDMSLMERLSSSGLPMSRIDVQRRMRPSIANLIRNTLYPTLEDHSLVQEYPRVRGFAKDVFFLSHNHAESGGDDSKYNTFEVEMIKDMVLYLLRQGCYSNEGDIVVLCAYLGQLARMRDALSDEVAVVIDERDQQLLAEQEDDQDVPGDPGVSVEHIKISKRVRLRTIDNFQGEEARIVILSLVRNSGGSEDDQPLTRTNIGFLRSDNRTNVALSRAKEGLFILGNAQNLSLKSKMWRSVLSDLEGSGAVGTALPIACQRHPDRVEYVSKPGQLVRVAPDGGCLLACDARLPCGHTCPYKCHSDDPRHVTVTCSQPCRRLCSRGHPCTKQCATECGQCMYPIAYVELPCGHVQASIPCYMLDQLSTVPCQVLVKKQLPTCEHSADMMCSQDPATYRCRAVCGGIMSCCSRSCKSSCSQCQGRNAPDHPGDERGEPPPVAMIQRRKHSEHSCERTLPCEHRCQQACSENHECTRECKAPCRQVCEHARCTNYCSTPCSPCQEPCTWACAHYTCPVPCGSVCARLPCDNRCDKMLSCGHQCPSVCGEDCSIQVCPICASEDEKSKIVDFIMQETLGNINPDEETLDQMLITLPTCRHVFTVETLDGLCDMKVYYRQDQQSGKWVGLEAPPPGFVKPPVCPTCRAAVTAPRYGRIFKRADLDILEKNVANRMARSLSEVSNLTEQISRPDLERRLKEEAQEVQLQVIGKQGSKERGKLQKRRQQLLNERRDFPVIPAALNPQDVNWHELPFPETGPWRAVVRPLMNAYERAVAVSKTRSAHIKAWESAFSCLAMRELDTMLMDPDHAPRNPREHSMRMARMLVGQPKPQADKRFCVEAFWVTINIRFTLAGLAQTWMDAVKGRSNYPMQQWQAWAMYSQFLLQSCLSDAKIALSITAESEARRQMTKTSLLIMRAELETFRLNLKMNRDSGIFQAQREKLLGTATHKRAEAESYKDSVVKDHLQKIRGIAEAEWVRQNFTGVAETIVDEWDSIKQSIRTDTFYEPVSIEEKLSIIKAFKEEFYGVAGHFYTCPNGHIYVIANCGGANQVSHCTECGASVGGSNHTLLQGNQRAHDMEELARGDGYERSPFPWGV